MYLTFKVKVLINIIQRVSMVSRLACANTIGSVRAVLDLFSVFGAGRSAQLAMLLPIWSIAEAMTGAGSTDRLCQIVMAVVHNSGACGALQTMDATVQAVSFLKH